MYEMIYYTGGRVYGQWNRTSVRAKTSTDAAFQQRCDEVKRMGYDIKVCKSEELDKHGVPLGMTHDDYMSGVWKGEL